MYMTVIIKDFYADWCGPCNRQHKILDTVEEEWSEEEDVTIEKIDIDDNQEEAQDYSVRSIPTILVSEEVDDEEEVTERFIGVTQESQISKAVEETLS